MIGPLLVNILVLIGGIASGKTTVARMTADRLPSAQVVTVSSVLARLAESERVDTSTRAALQRYGLDVIENRPEALARAITAMAKDGVLLVVDGLRSISVLSQLLSFDLGLRCVYLDVPTQVRKNRYESRRAPDGATFDAVDSHPVEQQVDLMRSLVHVEVDATRPPDEVVTQILAALDGGLVGQDDS